MRSAHAADRGGEQSIGSRDRASALRTVAIAAVASIALGACRPKKLTYADGSPRADGLESWIDRREIGFWTFTYPNGALREQGRYEDGHRSGVWEQWFPNGARRSRGERRYDRTTGGSEREGMWTLWHANGQRAATGTYRAGKREGHWDYTHPDGGLDGDRTGEYHDDVKLD